RFRTRDHGILLSRWPDHSYHERPNTALGSCQRQGTARAARSQPEFGGGGLLPRREIRGYCPVDRRRAALGRDYWKAATRPEDPGDRQVCAESRILPRWEKTMGRQPDGSCVLVGRDLGPAAYLGASGRSGSSEVC